MQFSFLFFFHFQKQMYCTQTTHTVNWENLNEMINFLYWWYTFSRCFWILLFAMILNCCKYWSGLNKLMQQLHKKTVLLKVWRAYLKIHYTVTLTNFMYTNMPGVSIYISTYVLAYKKIHKKKSGVRHFCYFILLLHYINPTPIQTKIFSFLPHYIYLLHIYILTLTLSKRKYCTSYSITFIYYI